VFAPARLVAVKQIPTGARWFYEPKFDGYRGLLVRSGTASGSVWSRNAKDLGRFFPELVDLAGRLPPKTALDGEIVRPIQSGVSFIELQRRLMTPLSERGKAALELPVAFIAFDLLQLRGQDLRGLGLSERRRRLQRLVEDHHDQLLQLVLQTTDQDAAALWLDSAVSLAGIEGVVAKADEPYPRPESRRWRKIRRVSTMDFKVHGFIPERDDSVRLVLAVIREEGVKIVGTTWPIGPDDILPLHPLIAAAVPGERRIWAPFETDRHDSWFKLPGGLVAEVTVSGIDSNVLRQPARFVRWRHAQPEVC